MEGKVSIPRRSGTLAIFRGDPTIMKEILQASNDRIAQLNKAGVAQGRTGIAEPERQHLPVLTNMEKYENWVKESTSHVMDKRLVRKEQNKFAGTEIEIENIFRDVTTWDRRKEQCRHVMILGAAGMGKTTLLRRIALYCGEEMLKQKFAIVLEFRSLPLVEKMSPSEVFLANIFFDRDSERMKQRYQWLLGNQDKIVFIIDSLDTLSFDLDSERPRIEYHTPATVDVILHNLLSRELFPKSLIVSSSREYKVRNLHPSVRPDRCVLLDGLKEDSVNDLIDGFLGEKKGAEVREHINTECPNIWPLLSIPVVLIYSMIGLVQDGFKPATLSGILIKFFTCLIRSPHAHVKDIFSVLKKLMPLSLEGIRKGFVLFTPKDLKRFGLEPEEVTDLGILIPQSQGTFLSTKLMQNDRFFLYFNHQTEQEALAALHVLSLYLVEFKTFVECEIWEGQFTVVRRLICGTLLNDEVLEAAQELTEISDVDQKKSILIQSLGVALEKYQQHQIKRRKKRKDLPELFIDLGECREGVTELIRSLVKRLSFSNTSLSPSDIQAVAFVIKQCEYLTEVGMHCSNINNEKMKILTRTIMQSNVKIEKFYISGNKELGPEGAYLLGKLVKNHEIKMLDAGQGTIRECKTVVKFIEGLGDAKIVYLNLSDSLVESRYTRSLLDLLPHVEKILSLRKWKINESQQQEFQQRLNEIGSPSLQVELFHECKRMHPIILKASLMDSSSGTSDEASTSGTSIVRPRGTSFLPKQSENETNLDSTTAVEGDADSGSIETAANVSAEIERRIKTASTKSKMICTEGGFIDNIGSKVTFFPEVFNADTEVQTSVITDFSDCPEDKVPIAPSIKCSPSGKLNKPALVEIDHWAFPTGSDFYVDVYRKENEDSERHFFKKVLVKANQKISFYTDHFTIYDFLVDCILWIRGIAVIHINVYISDSKQSIACVGCVKNDKVKNDVTQAMKDNGFVPLLPLPETAHIKFDDYIKISVKCSQPSNLRIISDDEGSVCLAKEAENIFLANQILKKCSEYFYFELSLQSGDLTDYKGMLRFRYSHTAGDDKANHPMPISWPITETQPITAQSRSITSVTGQYVNIGGQMTSEQHGGAIKITSSEIETSGQNVSSNVTAGTYNAGQMTISQSDTTTQVFGK